LALFAISDLHLPAREKPMDVFGANWENHFARVREDWLGRVRPEDVVLLPGDLTWAMRLEDALEDIRRVGELPGRKVLLRGNHDYWWSAIGRVRRALPENMYALQNDGLLLDGTLFAGSRGWMLPTIAQGEDDLRIYERERLRLEMSLKDARAKGGDRPLVALIHYPPLTEACQGFSDILERFGAVACVYGHLHGPGLRGAFRGERNGVAYYQASCDGLDFKLLEIPVP